MEGNSKKDIKIEEILELLPHRYPFLMVDRVLEVNLEEEYVIAIKNITINEPFFQGHFPGRPIMPGVLILEAMAQTAAVGLSMVFPQHKNKFFVLAGLDRVKFRHPVYPGDILVIEAKGFKMKGHIIRTSAVAKVEDKIVAEAEILAAVK
ncbi:MAG: 3-hydroxyacyl-ACP dehydratase FabZ [Thermodesulfobacteriaceae bacterium]|nr:3-hydroxyacyl-ACP dehydratase FabZ [Thermodesulfobacteriaceae bacterium]MCX8041764.1 3-hydroxyacyl-ACP dehydratase FabZ [Thermodesulfobacteriaceae bacterium]MDW8136048.1 3-hydroxyacyl-ACP dehydratase FabZ [Thermodesulfobacterium sp.]